MTMAAEATATQMDRSCTYVCVCALRMQWIIVDDHLHGFTFVRFCFVLFLLFPSILLCFALFWLFSSSLGEVNGEYLNQ